MRLFRQRGRATRSARFETVEPRLVMSGYPIGEPLLTGMADVPGPADEIGAASIDEYEMIGLAEARREYGFTGEGQTVVVIDTGIAYDHLALGGGLGTGYRVVGGFDFTGEHDADPYDDGPYGAHGTHVAGILASSDGTNPGVAPGVDLVALRVFDDLGDGAFGWIEDALGWVHENLDAFENPITTVNLSIGSDSNSDSPPSWSTIEDELAQLAGDGLFISVAAGNGFSKYQEPGLSYPGSSPYVVPVASVDTNGQLSYFSQRNDRVIAAPGRSVRSTVPDYMGDHNGVDDDFARFSGTSMAAPYVAGASALLRQAYEFVGISDVSSDALYNVMRSTADMVYDSTTGQSYHRLNLDRALDSIMPEDDFGSRVETAENLGALRDGQSFTGTIGKLDDRDFFSFTAAQNGQVTFSIDATYQLAPEWETAGSQYVADAATGTLTLDVSAGQTYSVGLATAAGLGHYTIDVELAADATSPEVPDGPEAPDDPEAPNGPEVPDNPEVPNDPETPGAGQREWSDQVISGAGQGFAFTAIRDGTLTAEAFFSHSNGDVDLQLFDASGRLLGGSYSIGDFERVDVHVSAGQTVHAQAYVSGPGVNENVDLRMTNLVAHTGQTVDVIGTEGNDALTFVAGAVHRIAINGVSYSFDADTVRSISFDGLAGSDTATLDGTMADETATFRANSAELSGENYTVAMTHVNTITMHGGGGTDTAYFHDSAGDDAMFASKHQTRLFGAGFMNHAFGFSNTYASATAGGFDTAHLFDSAGDDVYEVSPSRGKLYGEGFVRQADSFEVVHGHAVAGGRDTAYFDNSGGAELVENTSVDAEMRGNGYLAHAKYFEAVHATGGESNGTQSAGYGSALDDPSGDPAALAGAMQALWASAFDYLDPLDQDDDDRTEVEAVDQLLQCQSRWR